MTLRFKFTLLFSLLISLVLISSVAVIYYLYEQTREQDFIDRLWSQAMYSYSEFYKIKLTNKQQQRVDDYRPRSIQNVKVILLNNQFKTVFLSGLQQYQPDSLLMKKVASHDSVYFKYKMSEGLALHIKDGKAPGYIMAIAMDKYGYIRRNNLRLILYSVTGTGVFIITILSFFLVRQVTKPITELSMQMQKISESNLTERIVVKARGVHYEQRQVATHFNSMLGRLEKAFELQKSFVHHASHELRTPLATMLAQTELALRKELTVPEAKKVLASLKEDQQEMIELTNSLLLLSQYENVTLSPDWPVLRLDELLYDTLVQVKRMLADVNVSIEFAQIPDDDLFLSIRGNDSLIRSAFRNLIKNAWLYSDNKSVIITINATSTEICIYFDNTGKLLSQDEQERLFIPFFRASNSVQKKGFGLGLNIILRIVSLHKGRIDYSIHNNLNRFTLMFPKVNAQQNGV